MQYLLAISAGSTGCQAWRIVAGPYACTEHLNGMFESQHSVTCMRESEQAGTYTNNCPGRKVMGTAGDCGCHPSLRLVYRKRDDKA